MSALPLRLVVRNYDLLTPLLVGDIAPTGVDLLMDRTSPITSFRTDISYDAGEISFSAYARGVANGDDSIVGLPVVLLRGFQHRLFFVRRDSHLSSLKHLEGKRLGTTGWPDTGNTWGRALLRHERVDLESIEWWLGPIDGIVDHGFGHTVNTASPPSFVNLVASGRTLQEMLLADELDAIMFAWPPRIYHGRDSPIVRMFPDFRHNEQEYARAVGFMPGLHILGVRASFFHEHPEEVRALYEALRKSQRISQQRRVALADVSPWLNVELQQVTEILGDDWQAHGLESNAEMVKTLAHALYAQGLIDKPLDHHAVFAEFENLMR